MDLVPIVDRWSSGKASDTWLFEAPRGGPLRESNWKRSVGWSAATAAVGLQGFRVHDLRRTAASVWLGARADPKVVQQVLGHTTASITMDLYGHLVDANLWEAARAIGASWGHLSRPNSKTRTRTMQERTKVPGSGRVLGGAAYRNRTDDLRITRGLRLCSHSLTCTDSTANRTGSADCTGISRLPVP